MKTPNEILTEIFLDKVFTKAEFAEEGDAVASCYGKKIKDVEMTYDGEDPRMALFFTDGSECEIYCNEGLEAL